MDETEQTKRCSDICGEIKPLTEFYKRGRGGYHSRCKACTSVSSKEHRARYPGRNTEQQRERRVNNPMGYLDSQMRKYGKTGQWYWDTLAAQGGVCATPSCGKTPEENGRRLAVDHDHDCCPGNGSCGKCVGKLLCDTCNKILGMARDNPDILDDLAAYVRKHRRQPGLPFDLDRGTV